MMIAGYFPFPAAMAFWDRVWSQSSSTPSSLVCPTLSELPPRELLLDFLRLSFATSYEHSALYLCLVLVPGFPRKKAALGFPRKKAALGFPGERAAPR